MCYTAAVWLFHNDIDSKFFGEDGRTGYTWAKIWGDGKIKFEEEIHQLDDGEYYIFAQRPYDYPFLYQGNNTRCCNNSPCHNNSPYCNNPPPAQPPPA